ncbi:MAG TPA: DoxX family protein [Rhizomicrobium sp.]|jgi:putative oxidoreductase
MGLTFLARWQPQLLSVLRIMAGLLFLEHGSVKLLHFPASMAMPPNGGMFQAIFLTAGVIELVGGALVTVGALTRIAAFIMSGEMAIAYFLVHMHAGVWPIVNGGESAILFCFVFLYLSAAGPGAWAISKDT